MPVAGKGCREGKEHTQPLPASKSNDWAVCSTVLLLKRSNQHCIVSEGLFHSKQAGLLQLRRLQSKRKRLPIVPLKGKREAAGTLVSRSAPSLFSLQNRGKCAHTGRDNRARGVL